MSCAADLPEFVQSAAAGDQRAWERLVAGFDATLRAVARRHRLSQADQDEVAQRTWLALVEHIGRINEPAALSGWLVTTARRESLRILRESARERPAGDIEVPDAVHETDVRAEAAEQAARQAAVRKAIRRAPASYRPLLDALTAEPALRYEQVSQKLAMPIRSIGPTRARHIARLRRDPDVARLMPELAPHGRPTRPARPTPDQELEHVRRHPQAPVAGAAHDREGRGGAPLRHAGRLRDRRAAAARRSRGVVRPRLSRRRRRHSSSLRWPCRRHRQPVPPP